MKPIYILSREQTTWHTFTKGFPYPLDACRTNLQIQPVPPEEEDAVMVAKCYYDVREFR